MPFATALLALPAATQVVTYEVSFQGNWTTASTPGGVVGGAHFTTLIGGVHGGGVTFWEAGQQASPGVELVAELGSTGSFRSEVAGSPHTRSVIEQGVSGGGTGTAKFTISVTRTHPLVTLLSMIGPSPDWFVGVSGLSLLDGANQWRQSYVVNLYPYDAGTEDGTEFSLSNPDTDPQGVISGIAGTGKFSSVRMARLTFTRLTPLGTSVSLSASPNPVDEGQAVTVTVRLSAPLTNNVSIPLTLAAGTAESGDFGSLASITVRSNQTVGEGTISTEDDADADDETFTVALGTLPSEVTAGSPSSVTVTIRDDDPPPPPNRAPTVRASCEPCTVPRGGVVRLRADASDPDGDAIAYEWSAAQGMFAGATDGPDARWTAPGLLGSFVIRIAVSDGRGGMSDAEVVVDVENRPPVFGPSLNFELAENRDGRGMPIVIGRVRVTDPDGDDFEVGLASSNDRFVIDAESGHLNYTGPGEDFEAGPDRYALTVAATDTLGGEAQAEVVVHVINVNEHPAAVDDMLSVGEDRRTRVDVLANDGDPDRGDVIRVVSVGAPTHGQAEVVDAGAAVQYAPDPNYHGPDRFSYVVADTGGLADTATVEVTVTPVNDAPKAADDQATTSEDEAIEISVLDNDEDLEGDRLHVRSVSSAVHGEAAVTADGTKVSYAPDPDYHGSDRFTYVVADAGGLADTAMVDVTVTPVNDAPEAADDLVTTSEDEAIEISVLDNDTDIDGDRLQVRRVSSAEYGATATTADGTKVSYVPDSNYHGPDRFTYVVADAGGLADTATVEVTVTPVNDAPTAADDQVATPEDEAIEISVLDNDTDLDGDRLQVRSVSPAEHGAAAVTADGMKVSYVPDSNYHGLDRFSYIVSDTDGLTDTASVEVTVVPVNDGPEAVGTIPNQLLVEGGSEVAVELTPFFTDIEGDPLTFSAESSDQDIVTAFVRGAALVLVPVVSGHATVTVAARDTDGLAATQSVSVGVSDGPVRALLSDAFAAMARSYLSSTRMTLERRVAPGAHAMGTNASRHARLHVGGRSVELPERHTMRELARLLVTEWVPDPRRLWEQFAHRARSTYIYPGMEMSTPGETLHASSAVLLAPAGLSGLRNLARRPAGFSGGDFTLGWGGQANGSTRRGIAWALWGQSDVQRFDGGADEPVSGQSGVSGDYDGDLRARYLGLDAKLPNWLFGLALGRSRGTGDWATGAASGWLATSMTSVHPYLRWSGGGTSAWATFGAGRGEARNERAATGRVGTSPLDLAMGLVELRRRLGQAGDALAFGLRADAGWASLATGDGTKTIDGLRGRVHQARLGFDVLGEMRIGGAGLAPFGAVHLRNDGGDGQTGRGLELSGGLRSQIGIIGLDVQGRWLAFHTATRYRESGAGLTLTVGGREEEGFSLSASPRWGGQSRGGVALWRDRVPGMRPGPVARAEDWTMDARSAYRARLGGQLLEVATVYSRGLGGRSLHLAGYVGLRLANRR